MELTVKDFCDSFGIEETVMPEICKKMIQEKDFTYEILEGANRDKAILDELKRIDADTQVIAAPERTEIWEKGWNENLVAFKDSNYDLESLKPRYYKSGIPMRWKQEFIVSNNPWFETDFYQVFKHYIYATYLGGVDSIYEFGCGTGYNLVELAAMYPDKKLYGMDFSKSAVELLGEIREKKGMNIEGVLFDMIHPDFSLEIDGNSAIYTFGSLEQLGSQIDSIYDFFLEKMPKVCIHMEPTVEFYDDNNLIDYLSIKFHRKRGYTEGIPAKLEKLEKEGKILIDKEKRMYFGNLNFEGYHMFIWHPIQ